MHENNTLDVARSKALDVSLLIAKMSKVSEILPQIDELLEILTGKKAFEGKPMMRPPPPPAPKPIIIEALKPHHDGLTRHTLGKQTGLDPDIVQKGIDELVALGKIQRVKRQGWPRYALVE